MRKHLLWIALIVLIGSFLISSIFHTGWYTSHDGVYHILRTEEALKMLKLGQFPLRWAGSIDQGFGIPLFNFIYPLPYYLTAAFSLLIGPVWAVKTLIILSYLLGGLGIYASFGKKNSFIGFGLAIIYLMTPYQFLNIFVRGALGEILAMGIMPWAIYTFDLLRQKNATLKWYSPLPLGLLLIAHNFLGLLFGIFLLGYTLFQKENKKPLFISLLVSFSLAAFFFIPMLTERSFLYSLSNQFYTFRYDQHFVYLKQLLYGKWDYWYSVPGDTDGMSFQLGVAQMILSGLGILSIVFTKKINWSKYYLVIAYLGSIFLMTSRSFLIWEKVAILQTIQFPWRLLFMGTILTPVLGFAFLSRVKSTKLKNIAIVLLIVLSFINVRNYRRPMKQLSASEYTDLYLLNTGKSTTTFRTEILPKWSVPNERYKSEEIQVNSGNMILDSLSYDSLSLSVKINNKPDESVGRVTVLRNYYPAWKLYIDGQKKDILETTSEGMITFSPELGTHQYLLKMKSTRIEVIANLITLGSIICIGIIWRKKLK